MLWKNMMERLTWAAEILPICGLPITDALAVEEQELEALVESLEKKTAQISDRDQC